MVNPNQRKFYKYLNVLFRDLFISLFICYSIMNRAWSCSAIAELRILSQKEGVENMSRRIQHIFYNKENDWGYSYYISWNVSVNL